MAKRRPLTLFASNKAWLRWACLYWRLCSLSRKDANPPVPLQERNKAAHAVNEKTAWSAPDTRILDGSHAKRQRSNKRHEHLATIPHACHAKPPRRTHEGTCWRHAQFHLPIERQCRTRRGRSRARAKNESNTVPKPPLKKQEPFTIRLREHEMTLISVMKQVQLEASKSLQDVRPLWVLWPLFGRHEACLPRHGPRLGPRACETAWLLSGEALSPGALPKISAG